MLQSIHKDLIVEHTLIITFFLLLDLFQKEFFLDERIVEFSVSVAELVVLDEEFESFSESRFGSVVLSEGRHELRMLDDESRVQALSFQESSNKLVNQPDGGSGFRAINVVLFALGIEEDFGFF